MIRPFRGAESPNMADFSHLNMAYDNLSAFFLTTNMLCLISSQSDETLFFKTYIPEEVP